MSPVPPALFKAKGTTLRADEYLRGVNPVGTVHRGPLSAFGRQECSALRTEPSVAFSRTDRLEAIRPFSLEYFLPGEGNKAYAASHAREYLARHEAEGLDRFRRPAVSEPGEPRWKTFGASGRHQDFAKTPRARRPPPAQTRLAQQTGVAVGRERAPAPAPRRRPRRRAVQQLRETEAQHDVLTRTAPLREHRREDHAGRTRPPDPRPRTGRALPIARRVQPRAAGSTRRGRVQAGRARAADRGEAGDGAEGDCRDALPNHRADVATRRGQGRGLDVAGAAGPEHPGPGGVPRDFRFQATGDGPGEPD